VWILGRLGSCLWLLGWLSNVWWKGGGLGLMVDDDRLLAGGWVLLGVWR
jgi:hypothetical protein